MSDTRHPTQRMVGVDVGGTFTDVLLFDGTTDQIRIRKHLSTPHDPSVAFLEGVDSLAAEGVATATLDRLVHATTVATNTVLQRVGARTGLICTQGFRDVLEIGRGTRPTSATYDLQWVRPQALVPRFLRLGVPERTDSLGTILTPLDEAAFLDALAFLRGHEVASVAICFLFSYLNPANERRALELAQLHHPDLPVSVSSQILPQWREYERTSTTVCDAYVKPVMSRYIGHLQTGLDTRGFGGAVRRDMLIMKSNGGVMTAGSACRFPIETFLSGPAAAVVAAQQIGRQAGFANIISMDMGGTSFDVAMLDDGGLRHTTDGEIEPSMPVRIAMVDIATIGAGGGSIARVDEGGALKVGPRSAGSTPGPACYGRGGTEPTTTDANVVLGRIDPANFLGGAYRLDADAAVRAVQQVATRLGMSLHQAAQGILDVTVATMGQEIRAAAARRGRDLRDYTLFAGGGAGPLHAPLIARELGIKRVLVPRYPGMLSTVGLLLSDIRFDNLRSMSCLLESASFETLRGALREMATAGRARVREEGEGLEIAARLQIDMRYRRQNWELSVDVDPDTLDAASLASAFDAEHAARFGFAVKGQDHEIINLRCVVSGRIPNAERLLERLVPPSPTRDARPVATREIYDDVRRTMVIAAVFERDQLRRGQRIAGTAMILEPDSTLYVPSDAAATVDPFGNVVIAFT